eukprot:3244211-Prorocentrum_lima.AAC.1
MGKTQKWKPATSSTLRIKHEQDPHTGHVYTNQDHYVLELSEIGTRHVDDTDPDGDCDPEMHER